MKLRHSYSAINQFESCPKKYWHLRVAKDVADVKGEASLNGDRVHKSFEDRINYSAALPPELSVYEPLCEKLLSFNGKVQAETEYALTKDRVPTGWWDNDVWLRAKVDVTGIGEHKAIVVDWKTGNRRPDFFQLEISAAAVMLHNPMVDVVNTAFVWLKDNKKDSELITREQLPKIVDKIETKIARIEEALAEDVWQAKPGPLCAYCPAKDICSYADKRRR